MKIKLSKTKWNRIGRFAGWVKTDEFMEQFKNKSLETEQSDNNKQIDSKSIASLLSSFKNTDEIIKIVSERLLAYGEIDDSMTGMNDFSGEDEFTTTYKTTKNIDNNKELLIDVVCRDFDVIFGGDERQFELTVQIGLEIDNNLVIDSIDLCNTAMIFENEHMVIDVIVYIRNEINKSYQKAISKDYY